MQLPWQLRSLGFMIWDASSCSASLRNRCSWVQLKHWCDSQGWSGWALPRQLCCLQAETTSTRQQFCYCWISPGKSLCLAGAALQMPGSIRLQPVLLPLPRASTRQSHLPLPQELQPRRHNIPHVQTWQMWWQDGIQNLRTLSLHRVFSFRHFISCLCPNIWVYAKRFIL